MSKLGVFDSGLGGFNIVSHLREHSDVDLVFLADHKNLPYGLKDDDTLVGILIENIQWFKDRNINHILIACNTASNYIDVLRARFPELTIDSIIEITATQFTDEDLVIFGTPVTARSKMYDRYLKKRFKYHPLADLAALVEENDDAKTEAYLKEELQAYEGQSFDYLLACTHYSIVDDLFLKYCGNRRFDSLDSVVNHYKHLSGTRDLEVYSSGNIKILSDQLASMFNLYVPVLPFNKAYKIVLVSDNHGLYQPLADVVANHKDASVFIHCGDVELNDPLLDNFYVVNGNNDYFRPFDDHIILSIYDLRIYITHGDEYPRHSRYEDLHCYALSIHADFVCYGHEHVFKESYHDGMLLINPGSLYYNRDQTPPSYALLHIDNKDVFVERRVVEDNL